MEENSAAIECIIVFYINMKYVLKTKKLIERVFIDQMVKHCKKSGFNNYNEENIKTTWKNLVSKYIQLKSKGTSEEKECWKYFEILDSCYEQSDFHNGVYPKFSEEMVWFLIECFLKRKALKKTQKHNNIISEIHKEFLKNGYIHITKQDIENKWKNLNSKYEKLKNDPESLKKWPYLQALIGFHEEDKKHIVNMVFTKELTEILIERFTEKKITCVIHGYDSDQVLSEIQCEFKDLGFYFSKEDIREKWRTLTNIYKFLIDKSKKENSWIHFKAMRNHFQNDFLLPCCKVNKKIELSNSRPRRLRQRSKSVGAELMKNDIVKPSLIIQLDKVPSSHNLKLKHEEKFRTLRKNRCVKRTNENHRRSKSRKKLKLQGKINTNQEKNMENACQITEKCENRNQSNEISTLLQKDSHMNKLSFDENRQNNPDLGSPTSKVHIINIDHSDIDQKSGNLTINLPSITKQFSDNEFLPLKKRLRTDGENIEKHSVTSKEMKDGFLGFPITQVTNQKLSTDTSENKRLTEEEMREIMERINTEKSQNCDADNKADNVTCSSYCGFEEFNNYQNTYGHFSHPCLIVPKEEHQDNLSIQNYNSANTIPQPPVLLLVIKVDGSNNAIKDNVPNEINIKTDSSSNSLKDSPCKNIKKTKKKFDSSCKDEQLSILSHISADSIKAVSPKRKTIILSKKRDLIPLEANSLETSTVHNNEVVSDLVNSTTSQINYYNSEALLSENKQVTVHSTSSNNGDSESIYIESNELSDMCTVGENVTICTTEENQNEGHVVENKICKTGKTEEVIFREPLPVGKTELKMLDTHSATVIRSSTPPQVVKHQINSSKVRLPVKGGGKLKEIFISPRELNKIAKLKPGDFKIKNNNLKKVSEISIPSNTADTNEKVSPEFKFVSQVIKPAEDEISSKNKSDKKTNYRTKIDGVTSRPIDDGSSISSQSLKMSSKLLGISNSTGSRNGKNEEFENESVLSEAIGDDDGLKDNLLATVIDFQEQNNQEFIEIKNLMKQNNLLQRETNRLLRLILEKQ